MNWGWVMFNLVLVIFLFVWVILYIVPNNILSYLYVRVNKRTNNAIAIFNRYFHKKCNGKGLISISELSESIKEDFRDQEFKLTIQEKKFSKIPINQNKNQEIKNLIYIIYLKK